MQDRQAVEQHLISQTAGATRVGVVFVHGIGQQSESSTVREFGGPLLHWLQEWHQRRDGDLCVASSDLTYGELAERPARFSLELAAIEGHPAQTWILAEAWWAARLSAPNLDEMTWWGLKSAVVRCLRLAELVVTSFRNIRSPKDVIELVSSFLLFLGYVAAAILSIPLILGLFVLAQIPGPVEQALDQRLVGVRPRVGRSVAYSGRHPPPGRTARGHQLDERHPRPRRVFLEPRGVPLAPGAGARVTGRAAAVALFPAVRRGRLARAPSRPRSHAGHLARRRHARF